MVERYVLQIEVGAGIQSSATRQAMLLTTVNASRRAFLGGVKVRLSSDGPIRLGWAQGQDISTSVRTLGGEVVEEFDPQHPTVVIGHVGTRPPGSVVVYATWQGWSGGIVEEPGQRLAESVEFPLAGVLAGALAVSEAFQHVRGFAPAGRRRAGLSLWQPEQDWWSESSYGPPSYYLPSRLWLIGLGHLGQAFSWVIGLLPYADPSSVEVMLQDYDFVVEANESTGLLSDSTSVGYRKARVVADRLEALGFKTTINERPFDQSTRRRSDEPGVALVGLDDPAPRRFLEGAGFDLVIDAGLGGSAQSYLDMLIHAFPSGIEAARAWPEGRASSSTPVDQPAYQHLQRQLAAESDLHVGEGDIECGVLEVAGRSVGAAFVGCAAAALVFSEALRFLTGGPRLEIVSLSLRSPHMIETAPNNREVPPVNPGFVVAQL